MGGPLPQTDRKDTFSMFYLTRLIRICQPGSGDKMRIEKNPGVLTIRRVLMIITA
jgi:hypothetical protein